jgi:hypothetical protein
MLLDSWATLLGATHYRQLRPPPLEAPPSLLPRTHGINARFSFLGLVLAMLVDAEGHLAGYRYHIVTP